MQSVSSRIWTRVAVSISYDDNDYTKGNSCKSLLINQLWCVQLWNVTYDFDLTLPSVAIWWYRDSFWDRRLVAVQLLFSKVLFLAFI